MQPVSLELLSNVRQKWQGVIYLWVQGGCTPSWTPPPSWTHPLGQTPHCPADTHPPPGQIPPPVEMNTEAGGTHPTGMHSCSHGILVEFSKNLQLMRACYRQFNLAAVLFCFVKSRRKHRLSST